MAKTVIQSKENAEGINALAMAIHDSKKKLNTPKAEIKIEPVIEAKEEITQNVNEEIKPEIKTEPIPNTEIKTEVKQEIKSEKKTLSIWDQIKKPTEEDKNISAASSTNDIVNNLAIAAVEDPLTDANAKKQGNKVKAAIYIEIADVIFNLLCLVITWDFSTANQEKFKLHKDRKQAIENNLFKIFELSNKTPNPKKEIWFLILGSYVPMLLVALMVLIARLRNKQKEKEKEEQFQIIVEENKTNNANHLVEMERMKTQNQFLINEIETLKNGQGKKSERNPVSTLNEKKSRGVKLGEKRGSYKKKK
jgi:hypothetical protein